MIALRLHAVTAFEAGAEPRLPGGARAIAFRDLAAIVTERPKFSLDSASDEQINEHRSIVDAVFKTQVVLPTPLGVVFRAENVLTRWMELHYVSLSDGLSFVHDRVGARVHVSRTDVPEAEKETGTEVAEAATDIFRELRRYAVALVPLTTEQMTGIAVSSAFLVEREKWKGFGRAAFDARKSDGLTVEMTGPWAPYDFVRMQFGD